MDTEIIKPMSSAVLVNDNGIRPSDPSRCYYCKQLVGQNHLDSCVCLEKKVKIRAIIEYEIEVPYSWNKTDIEFHRNEGSWCASNMIEELNEIDQRDNSCLCSLVKFEFVEEINPGPYSKISERQS